MPAKTKPTKEGRKRKPKKSKPRRKELGEQLEAISKLIVFWRDGAVCVEKHLDGARCGGGIQWGHFIPRNESKWLKYDLGNTFCQCRNHNNLHDKGSQTMAAWFGDTFGNEVQKAFQAERDAHRDGKDRQIFELEEMLAHYDQLYQNRFYVNLDLESHIEAGYYGEIIRQNWKPK